MHSKLAKAFFVTGTDTSVGKTTVTRLVMTELQKSGFKSIGIKPIACGVNLSGYNEDALAYEEINDLPLTKQEINPYCFDLPASPNIAAKMEQREIKLENITSKLLRLRTLPVDYIFYEGAGGWKVPINDNATLADLVFALQIPVIIIVGIRVGCLNHALLTWETIARENIKVAGWIGNVIEPSTPQIEEHITTLKRWIPATYLGTVLYRFHHHDLNIDILKKCPEISKQN